MWERGSKSGTLSLVRLTILFAVLLTLNGWYSALFAQQRGLVLQIPATDEVSTSLTLINPSDANFSALLDEYFPGVSSVPNFQNMRPYLMLIRNDTALPAVAYALKWDVVYQYGGSQTLEKDYVLRPLDQGSNIALPPGSIRLISPLFNLTPQEYQAAGDFAELYSGPLPSITEVDPSVDGVAYSDGTYSGPEGAQVCQRYVTARFAAHDEAVSVLTLLISGTPLATLLSTLSMQIQRGLWLHGTDAMDMYVYARGQSARDVKILILRDGQAQALQVLSRVTGSPALLTAFGPQY